MPPSLHAVLGASSAHRWLICTPSARLCEKLTSRFGSESSPYAAEGTKAHALAEMKVRLAYYKADGMTAAKHSRMAPEQQEASTSSGSRPFGMNLGTSPRTWNRQPTATATS